MSLIPLRKENAELKKKVKQLESEFATLRGRTWMASREVGSSVDISQTSEAVLLHTISTAIHLGFTVTARIGRDLDKIVFRAVKRENV